MANVRWAGGGTLDYISGVIVYEIDPNELFTRALYTGFLKIGKVVAKIPFQFDPNFDSFWVSPDGRNLLLNKGGRNIFLYYITLDDFHDSGVPLSLPYLSLPRDTTVRKVIWSAGNVVTMLCETRSAGRARHDRVPSPAGRCRAHTGHSCAPMTRVCWTSPSHRTGHAPR